ncbi:MAG: hypothetical protein OEY61_08140 [Gammaproteobacteria bacterium]|nr:hypothetical protein [Gammaproteobacteria bacterium]
MILFNKPVLTALTLTTLCAISLNSNAACSRDDVEFYLTKGFTPTQITSLCETTSLPQPKSPVTGKDSTVQTRDAAVKTPATTTNDTELFLREAIKGRHVLLNHDILSYTLKVCIKYGAEDLYGFAPKACPNVRFTISLDNLTVKEPEKKLFFAPDGITVSGRITREIIDGLDQHDTNDQQSIRNNLESGNETTIPIRDDISIDQAFRTLEQLSIQN